MPLNATVHASLVVKTAPTVEGVTLTEAKNHLRVDGADDDAVLNQLIPAVRLHVEQIVGRALNDQTLILYLDRFPPGDAAIELPRPPGKSVTSIKYLDGAGATITWDSANYTTDFNTEPARIMPAVGISYPTTQDVVNAVFIEYVAGYGAAETDVPQAIRTAMLMMVGHLFEHREPVVVGQPSARVELAATHTAVELLLEPYRTSWF